MAPRAVRGDAMAVEILDNAESTLTCATLHGSPNVPKFASGPGGIHGFKLSKSSRAQESLGQGRYFANRGARASVGPISVQLGRDVDVDQISLVKRPSQRRNAVRRFTIQTDAGGAREVVGQSGAERAPKFRKISRPIASSSPVVMPGSTAATIASRALATTRPARMRPSRSSSLSIVTIKLYVDVSSGPRNELRLIQNRCGWPELNPNADVTRTNKMVNEVGT